MRKEKVETGKQQSRLFYGNANDPRTKRAINSILDRVWEDIQVYKEPLKSDPNNLLTDEKRST